MRLSSQLHRPLRLVLTVASAATGVMIGFLCVTVLYASLFGGSWGEGKHTAIEIYSAIVIPAYALSTCIIMRSRLSGRALCFLGIVLNLAILPSLAWFIPAQAPPLFFVCFGLFPVLWLLVCKSEPSDRVDDKDANKTVPG